MKKCVIFFTLLLITLGIAVLTEDKSNATPTDEVAIEEITKEKLLAEDLIRAID
jgi:hypothetical protein